MNKTGLHLLFCFIGAFSVFHDGFSQGDLIGRKENRKQLRKEFRQTKDRYFFKIGTVNANLSTEVAFELADGFLTTTLGLENNLGLPGKRYFITGSFLHRITPVSGFYAQYYGISRNQNHITERDIIFMEDTIPSGTTSRAFFNTNVISFGYLLSILQDPNAFLGAYFNIYLMRLNTGISSDLGNINTKVKYTAPLPNFGLIAKFKLTNWLGLSAKVGFFSLHTNEFEGSLYDLDVSLTFKPVKWMGLSLSYQEFDIQVSFPYKDIKTTVNYNFRGPAVGVSINF